MQAAREARRVLVLATESLSLTSIAGQLPWSRGATPSRPSGTPFVSSFRGLRSQETVAPAAPAPPAPPVPPAAVVPVSIRGINELSCSLSNTTAAEIYSLAGK